MRSPAIYIILGGLLAVGAGGCGMSNLASTPLPAIVAPERIHAQTIGDRSIPRDLLLKKSTLTALNGGTASSYLDRSAGDRQVDFIEIDRRSSDRYSEWRARQADLTSSHRILFVHEEPVDEVALEDPAANRALRDYVQSVQERYYTPLLSAELRATVLSAKAEADGDENSRKAESAKLGEATSYLKALEDSRDSEIAHQTSSSQRIYPEAASRQKTIPTHYDDGNARAAVFTEKSLLADRVSILGPLEVNSLPTSKLKSSMRPVGVVSTPDYRDRVADMCESIDDAVATLRRLHR